MAFDQSYGAAQKTKKEAQQQELLKQAGTLMQNGDQKGALSLLIGGGNLQGAQVISSMQNADADRTWRREEATRSQSNSDRQYKLTEQNANKPQIKMIKDAAGNDVPYKVGSDGSITPVQGFQPAAVTNPYAAGGKLNADQGKAATFADRMVNAHKVISENENINQGTSGAIGGALANSSLPLIGGDSALYNTMSSDNRQKFNQAQRDFVNAILRKESGAAISQSEFENAKRQYFPQPGDNDAVLKQKATNRQTAIEGNMREAGSGYAPPPGWNGKQAAPAQAATPQRPAAATPAQGGGQAAAAAYLKTHPEKAAEYEAKYGPGSAAAALGQ